MTAIEKIINFVNSKGKPVWWKHCVRLAIEKGELQKDDADFLYGIAKMEAGLLEKGEEFSGYQKDRSSPQLASIRVAVGTININAAFLLRFIITNLLISHASSVKKTHRQSTGCGKYSRPQFTLFNTLWQGFKEQARHDKCQYLHNQRHPTP